LLFFSDCKRSGESHSGITTSIKPNSGRPSFESPYPQVCLLPIVGFCTYLPVISFSLSGWAVCPECKITHLEFRHGSGWCCSMMRYLWNWTLAFVWHWFSTVSTLKLTSLWLKSSSAGPLKPYVTSYCYVKIS
jgi:hypothetical protein